MLSLKAFIFTSLIIGIASECAHEWVSFRDVNLVKSQGLTAGNFKRNVPSYIGQAQNPRGFIVPGRIQLEHPKGLYYVSNMKVERTSNSVEFLRRNEDYNYTWVDVDLNKCINNAVIVDNEFYIGRTLSGDFTFLGQVKIGEKGLKYENQQGNEVLTNDYQILTCLEITENVEDLHGELETCKENLKNSKTQNLNAKNEINNLKTSNANCVTMQQMLRTNSDLLNEKVKRLEDDARNCGNNFRTPAPECDTNSQQLQAKNDDLTRRLTAATQGMSTLTQENKRLQNELGAANQRITSLNRQVTKFGDDILTLQNKIQELNDEKVPCAGSSGCVRALTSVNSLTQEEQLRLLLLIKDKASQADREKYGD